MAESLPEIHSVSSLAWVQFGFTNGMGELYKRQHGCWMCCSHISYVVCSFIACAISQ